MNDDNDGGGGGGFNFNCDWQLHWILNFKDLHRIVKVVCLFSNVKQPCTSTIRDRLSSRSQPLEHSQNTLNNIIKLSEEIKIALDINREFIVKVEKKNEFC